MLTDSRTQNQIFSDEYQLSRHNQTWREYWASLWEIQINRYAEDNWKLIPISIRDKRPLKGWFWKNRTLGKEKALFFASRNINLAVVLGPSKLVCLDYETRPVPQAITNYIERTYTAITPRGYHIYFDCAKEPGAEIFRKLDKIISNPHEWRGGIQYCLVPLSVVGAPAYRPPKIYEWINHKCLMNFKDFIGEILK